MLFAIILIGGSLLAGWITTRILLDDEPREKNGLAKLWKDLIS